MLTVENQKGYNVFDNNKLTVLTENTEKTMYPSDLDTTQWLILKGYLSPYLKSGRMGRPRQHSYRALFNGIFYLLRSGCAWRMLPKDFPPWQSVYHYFRKWEKSGMLKRTCRFLVRRTRKHLGRRFQPTAASLDSQSVQSADHKGSRGKDPFKKVTGIKRNILVDVEGLLLGVVVTDANVHDTKAGKEVLKDVSQCFWNRIVKIWADGSYTGPFQDWVWDEFGWEVEVKAREDGQKGFVVVRKRWVVERTFGWLLKQRRLSKNYEQLHQVAEAMVRLAAISTMLRKLIKPKRTWSYG